MFTTDALLNRKCNDTDVLSVIKFICYSCKMAPNTKPDYVVCITCFVNKHSSTKKSNVQTLLEGIFM